jgi:hypothetical protein
VTAQVLGGNVQEARAAHIKEMCAAPHNKTDKGSQGEFQMTFEPTPFLNRVIKPLSDLHFLTF